jgi:hypothetical protein
MSKLTIEEMRVKQAEQRTAIKEVQKHIGFVLECPDWDEFMQVDNRDELAERVTNHSYLAVVTPAIEELSAEDMAMLLWNMSDRIIQLRRKLQKFEQAHKKTVGELLQDSRTLAKLLNLLADDEDLYDYNGKFAGVFDEE